MTLAVVKFAGKQYLVTTGAKIRVSNFGAVGDEVSFGQVLLVADGRVKIGKPEVKNVKITGKIVKKFSGPKVSVVKFRPKSRYLRRTGFRQKFSEVEITKIELGSKKEVDLQGGT